ncbi:MAG: AraC family transcriptional regulator [Flavobacteriales bacterium]|jgi:AraC-like DNA-binding protein|nr:AraC family transcriptional regulator [Flavobacteriales bacterium]
MNEQFILYKPRSKKLRAYIKDYYFHKDYNKSKTKKIVYYPTIYTGLTIYKSSKVLFISPSHSIAIPDEHTDYFYCFTSAYYQAGTAEIRPPFQKIGIVFEPFGINQFIEHQSLFQLTKGKSICMMNYFKQQMDMIIGELFSEISDLKKIEILDEYFERQFLLNDCKIIKQAIAFIEHSPSKPKVNELAQHLNIHRRTLLRNFRTHLNCSIQNYIKAYQFRKAFNYYLNAIKKPSLIDLSYQFNYYDQAEFNKQFKTLAGASPKTIFSNIRKLAQNDYFWKIE